MHTQHSWAGDRNCSYSYKYIMRAYNTWAAASDTPRVAESQVREDPVNLIIIYVEIIYTLNEKLKRKVFETSGWCRKLYYAQLGAP